MPIADRNSATNPNASESNAGERRLASDRSVQYRHRLHLEYGKLRIDGCDLSPQRTRERAGITIGPQHEREPALRLLRQRDEVRANQLVAVREVAKLHLAHDADHGVKLRLLSDRRWVIGFVARTIHSTADGILIGPEATSEPVVHDDGARGAGSIAFGEEAAGNEFCTDGFEVPIRDPHLGGRQQRFSRPCLISLRKDGGSACTVSQRQTVGRAGGFYSRQCAHAAHGLSRKAA